MNRNLSFNEKFSALEEYYMINSPEEVKVQLRNNEKIFQLLEEFKPYLEEYFSDAEFCLDMNFEPEFDDKFIILFVNVSKDAFNNGIGDKVRSFDLKTKHLRKELNIFRDLLIMPEIKNV